MNLLLPDLPPAGDAAGPLLLEPTATTPTDLPEWMPRAPRDVLEAVMLHPAAEITAALAAIGTAELQPLLEYLAGPAWLREAPEAVV